MPSNWRIRRQAGRGRSNSLQNRSRHCRVSAATGHRTLVQSLPQGQGLVERLAKTAITAFPPLAPGVPPRIESGPEAGRATGVAVMPAIPERRLGKIGNLAGGRRTQGHPPIVRGNRRRQRQGQFQQRPVHRRRHNPARNSAPAGSAAAAATAMTQPGIAEERRMDRPQPLVHDDQVGIDQPGDRPGRRPSRRAASTPAATGVSPPAKRRPDRPGRGNRRRGRRPFA